jgi:hypothetical protein
LASQGFVAPTSQNFAVNAVAQGIAYPGGFEDTTVYTGYLDVGAVQHQNVAGPTGHVMMIRGDRIVYS